MAKKPHTPRSQPDEVRRGKRATQILSDPIVNESFKAIQDDLIKRWRLSKTGEQDLREALWAEIRGADTWLAKMAKVMQTGQMAAAQIEKEQENVGGRTPDQSG